MAINVRIVGMTGDIRAVRDSAGNIVSGIMREGDEGRVLVRLTSDTTFTSFAGMLAMAGNMGTAGASDFTSGQDAGSTMVIGAYATMDLSIPVTALADMTDEPDEIAIGFIQIDGPQIGRSGGLMVNHANQALFQILIQDDLAINGTAAADLMNGTGRGDILLGHGGPDTLLGHGGADVLEGGAGNDVLDGGAGIDTARYAGNAATVIDLLLTGPQATGSGRDTLISIENLQSGSGNDWLRGSHGANQLAGGAGNDLLEGRAGDDTLLGGDGDDRLDGGPGNDLINGGAGADTLVFITHADVTVDLRMTGAQATGVGTDRIIGVENLVSGRGNDSLTGSAANNHIRALAGNDTLSGLGGHDLLEGEAGNDLLMGGDGHDTLRGGLGDDVLQGGNGNDRLEGGAGRDVLTGGAGADLFAFGFGTGADRVTDFVNGQDRIELDTANPAAPRYSVSQVAEGTLISAGNNSLLLVGVSANLIDANDFLFV